MVQPLRRIVWQFLLKVIILLLYDVAVLFLGIFLKELKTYVLKKTAAFSSLQNLGGNEMPFRK